MTDVKLWLLYSNIWNHLTVCKKELLLIKNVISKMCLQIAHTHTHTQIYIYILYQCSRGKFKIMPIYQTNNYTLLQIKEKNFIDKFKPKLNKTWIVHTCTNGNKHTHTYIYIYLKKHIRTLRERITTSEIRNHSNIHTHTHTLYQLSKVNEG